jgi:hypothetical protein
VRLISAYLFPLASKLPSSSTDSTEYYAPVTSAHTTLRPAVQCPLCLSNETWVLLGYGSQHGNPASSLSSPFCLSPPANDVLRSDRKTKDLPTFISRFSMLCPQLLQAQTSRNTSRKNFNISADFFILPLKPRPEHKPSPSRA